MKQYINKNKTFLKYVLSNTLILIFLLIGFTYILNYELKTEFQESIYDQSKITINNLAVTFSNQIQNLLKINYSILNDFDIIYTQYVYDNYTRMMAIKELQKYISSSNILLDIIYQSTISDTILSASSVIFIQDDNLDVLLNQNTFTLTEDDITKHPEINTIAAIKGSSKKEFIFLPRQEYTNSDVMYVLNDIELKELLSSIISDNIIGTLLINGNNEIVLSSDSSLEDSVFAGDTTVTHTVIHLDKTTTYFITPIDGSNLQLVALLDKTMLAQAVNKVFSKSYFSLFFITVIALIIITFSIKITYGPVKRLIKQVSNKGKLNQDDINSLSTYLESVEKENDSLQEKIGRYQLAIQKSIFESFEQNDTIGYEIFEKVDTLFHNTKDTLMFVAVIELTNKEHHPTPIIDYLKSIATFEINCIMLEKQDTTYTYLIEVNSCDQKKEDLVSTNFLHISQFFTCKVALSNFSQNPMDIAILYAHAKKASEFFKETDFVLYQDIPQSPEDNSSSIYPHTLLDELNGELHEHSYAKAKVTISALLDSLDNHNNPEFFIRCVLIDTLTRIISSTLTENIKAEKYMELYLETLYYCRDVKYVKEQICDKFYNIIDILSENIVTNSLNVGSIKQFITDNYTDHNLSIIMIADEFNVSVAYISYFFKKKTNANISSYLWELRDAKAKELLATTKLSIAQISTQIGYDNASSFRRKFKEENGICPSELRILSKDED